MFPRNYDGAKGRSCCIKCLLYLLTTLLLLIGLGLFGALTLVKVRYSYNGVNVSDIGIIILASLICLIAIVGYWGTCQSSPMLLKFFIGTLIVLTCLTIMIDILVFTQPEVTRTLLSEIWTNLNDHGRIEFQKLLLCCDVSGINGTMSYYSSWDISCFKERTGQLSTQMTPRKDCYQALFDIVHKYMHVISGIIGGVMILNIVLMLLSCVLVIGRTEEAKEKRNYFSFPVVTDVILWKRRSKQRMRQIESGIFELPPTYPTGPILQAYKNSIEKSVVRL